MPKLTSRPERVMKFMPLDFPYKKIRLWQTTDRQNRGRGRREIEARRRVIYILATSTEDIHR